VVIFEKNLNSQLETRVVARVFGLYSATIHWLDKKIAPRKFFDFSSKKPNFPGFYLFLKSTKSCPANSQKTINASSLHPQRQIFPKHQRHPRLNWSKGNQQISQKQISLSVIPPPMPLPDPNKLVKQRPITLPTQQICPTNSRMKPSFNLAAEMPSLSVGWPVSPIVGTNGRAAAYLRECDSPTMVSFWGFYCTRIQ
jgi:hypothetical protein